MFAERFHQDGFVAIPTVLPDTECDAMLAKTNALDDGAAGTRCLLTEAWCRTLAQRLHRHPKIAAIVPDDFVAVQCTYFEKSVGRNWLVPIHQDLSIPVMARVDTPALRGWSEKEGGLFVQPPSELLAQLVAVRVHLDPCTENDGPLQFLPGSHLHGRIGSEEASAMRSAGPLVTCTMAPGDALLMRPLVLHASSKASGVSKRRVLHFVFGPRALPLGLVWRTQVSSQAA